MGGFICLPYLRYRRETSNATAARVTRVPTIYRRLQDGFCGYTFSLSDLVSQTTQFFRRLACKRCKRFAQGSDNGIALKTVVVQ